MTLHRSLCWLAAAGAIAFGCSGHRADGVAGRAAREPPPVSAGLDRIGSLELLGSIDLPVGLELEGEPVGGLSGLAWDEPNRRFLALSDDSSERAPARLYELAVRLGEDARLEPQGVRVAGRIRLLDPAGQPFARGALDPEGFALRPNGELLIASEGVRASGAPPLIGRFAAGGGELGRLPLAERYLPDATRSRGVRPNLGFESLAVTPDGRTLIAGLENALEQDGPAADFGVASPARLLLRDLDGRRADRELVYAVEPVRQRPARDDSYRVNGLVDLIALSAERLLALEREYVAGAGTRVALYEIDLADATDVATVGTLRSAGEVVPVAKRLLLDFAELGVELDNFEAMAIGPELPDGRRLLLVVSDDNFNRTEQRTRVVALAVDRHAPTIAEIQGAGHRSPTEGRWMTGVEGVVTAVDARGRPPAFFLQSSSPDANAATSDAIRVVGESLEPPALGDRVRVAGRVEERALAKQLPVTTLGAVGLQTLARGAPLPPPVRVDARAVPGSVDADGLTEFRPERDAIDFWESLEAMRVEIPAASVTGPTLAYGELVVALDDTLPRSAAGGLLLTPAGPTPDRVAIGGRLGGGLPDLSVGARLAAPVVGVVDYSYSIYKVLASARPPVASEGTPCREIATRLAPAEGTLTLATSNVENLSYVDAPERFALAARVIARELRSPAIVALEEIQDDSGKAKGDGVVTAEKTLRRLVDAIVEAGGPSYRSISIDPELDREGGVPGGNIRVALLYDPARVGFEPRGETGPLVATEPVGRGRELRLSVNPGRIEPRSAAFSPPSGEGVRRSLAAELRVAGRPLFVVANHWSSKFDDDRAFGAAQPPAAPTAAKRAAQAAVVRAFVERLLEADPAARVVALGDFNDFPWSEAVREISRPPLANLLLGLPEAERYTYNFEGVSQALDYVVVSPALAAGAEVEPVHRNSDCPESLRSSDHDPVVARLRLDG